MATASFVLKPPLHWCRAGVKSRRAPGKTVSRIMTQKWTDRCWMHLSQCLKVVESC